MNDRDIDVMLREYAPRWRAAQPPAPTRSLAVAATATTVGWRRSVLRRPWLPVLATAAAVALIAAATAVVRYNSAAPVPPAQTPSPGVVAWQPLPGLDPALPTIVISPSPDPSVAQSLRPCRAGDLRVTRSAEGASGTRYVFLEIRSVTTPCRLGGYPTVTPLDPGGRALAVPVEPAAPGYGHPVAVGGPAVATLSLGWASLWCVPEVDVATLRLDLPDGGGPLTVKGFGRSNCFGVPGSGEKAPIRVGEFHPQEFQAGRMGTPFDEVGVEVRAPASVRAGTLLRFTVVLTAPPDRDVPLVPCPDYRISLGTTFTYGLNCSAVPYRDGSARPYLPAGVPVAFAMQIAAPARPDAGAKLTWQLDRTDAVGGGVVDVI
jgi:hypothetical protein